jgi:hypothetical protein
MRVDRAYLVGLGDIGYFTSCGGIHAGKGATARSAHKHIVDEQLESYIIIITTSSSFIIISYEV